jgi:hypothetical protein
LDCLGEQRKFLAPAYGFPDAGRVGGERGGVVVGQRVHGHDLAAAQFVERKVRAVVNSSGLTTWARSGSRARSWSTRA